MSWLTVTDNEGSFAIKGKLSHLSLIIFREEYDILRKIDGKPKSDAMLEPFFAQPALVDPKPKPRARRGPRQGRKSYVTDYLMKITN